METDQHTSRSTSLDRPAVRDRIRHRIVSEVGAQKARAVDKLMGVADTVRRIGEPLRGQPYAPVVKYVETAAERVEQAALYLRQHELNEVVDDVRRAARRRPGVFIGVGFLAGAIAGRVLRVSNRANSPRSTEQRAARTSDARFLTSSPDRGEDAHALTHQGPNRAARVARSVQDNVGRLVRHRPLVAGAAAVGLGVMVSMGLPKIRRGGS